MTTTIDDRAVVLTVGVSDEMARRMRDARNRDGGFRLHEAASQSDAVSILGDVAPDVMILALTLRSGSAMAVADYATFRRPAIRIVYEMDGGRPGFEDGSIFDYCPNAHGCVTPSMDAGDMAAVVAHHAAPRIAA